MGIIDLIALLASIANDASQTSSQVDDREEPDLATHSVQAIYSHKGKCKSTCSLFKLWLGLVGESVQMEGCSNYTL